MANTGNITVTERDINPFSPTYNQTRTRTYVDTDRCALPSTDYKLKYVLLDGTTGYVPCNGNPILLGTDYTNVNVQNIKTAIVGTCVETIGDRAFYQFYSLTDVVMPNSVTKIAGNTANSNIYELCFSLCSNLSNITLPNSIDTITHNTFVNCALTSFNLPYSVTNPESFSSGFIMGCNQLTSLTVDASNPRYDSRNNCNCIIETATNKLVQGCRTSVIPNGVEIIDITAFGYFSPLSITIPNSVTRIRYHAFLNAGLSSIDIPESVNTVESGAFENCNDLLSITVDANNQTYDSRNNCNAIIETATDTLVQGCRNTVIPNDIEVIGYSAFYGMRNLLSVTMPDTLTTIQASAFRNCSGLTSITIPSNVNLIQTYAFNGCTSLNSITCLPTTPPTIDMEYNYGNPFNNTNNCPIYVPAGSVNAYKTADKWSDLASRIQAIPA